MQAATPEITVVSPPHTDSVPPTAATSSGPSPSSAPPLPQDSNASPQATRSPSEQDKVITESQGTSPQLTASLTVDSTTDVDQSRRFSRSSGSSSSSNDSSDDRIRGIKDVWEAFKLAFRKQKKHLFTAWVHVPLGVTFLLVCVWALKLLIDIAPFRFPAAVLAMAGFFFLLLILDWLSIKFPGSKTQDVESSAVGKDPEKLPEIRIVDADEAEQKAKESAAAAKRNQRKRFVDPVMLLLAPPCEWCLRNMSVMFTPSFILIPARETLPAKEIGLLTGWFAATQVLGFVFPVLACFLLQWTIKQWPGWSKKLKGLRRHPTFSKLTPLASTSTATSRKNSMATLAGFDFEKGVSYAGGNKLGPLATGLSGVTAVVVAPVSHVPMSPDQEVTSDLDDDARSQFQGVAMENARQQGDPYMRRTRSAGPKSTVSTFEHPAIARFHQHHHHHHHQGADGRARSRSRSRSRDRRHQEGSDARARLASRPGSADDVKGRKNSAPLNAQGPAGAAFSNWNFPARHDHTQTSSTQMVDPRAASIGMERSITEPADAIVTISEPSRAVTRNITFDAQLDGLPQHNNAQSHGSRRNLTASALVPSRLRTVFTTEQVSPGASRSNSLSAPEGTRILRADSVATLYEDPVTSSDVTRSPTIQEGIAQTKSTTGAPPATNDSQAAEQEGPQPDAIERLADWIADLITPTVYFVAFIVGLPLYYILDFALVLFLSVNILTFVASITIVPPRVRRFLHPILATSISTVLILWALGAIKGLSIKETLAQYSVGDARYTDVWNPNGYNGPVSGAGDILFSTLDAGIVALAIPMYRYRKDLRENFFRMIAILIPCAALSLFLWPTLGRFIGLDPIRALAFSARFMSTPLAIELANTVGADESITIILVVLTGIIAAILKEPFFKMMRVRDDDFVTWGITMGSTSGAIGASSLISKPRTMAIASLSFVLFGAILLIAVAIPPIVDVMHSLAGDPATMLTL